MMPPPAGPVVRVPRSAQPCTTAAVLLAVLVVLAVGLAAAACGADGRARSGRTLVAAIASDPGHLNPAITTGGGVHTAAALLYNGLVGLDEAQNPVPELAERWVVEDGGRVYRFHLRRDVRWHDGRPFTAADVTFTFEELLLRFHARTRASLGPALAAIDAPDDHTVEFRFERPYAPLLQQLNVVEAPILPAHVYRGADPQRHPANTAPIGTGPFRFVDYRPDHEIRYEANRDYFGGAPAVDELVLRVIPDEGMQVIALEAGEVDWLYGVPGAERERLRRNGRVRFIQTAVNPGGSNCIMTIGFNLDRPVLRDLRVRTAIAHGLDRGQFLDRVLFGAGRVAEAPISSRIAFAHAPGLGIPAHDPAAAAALLEAAGWMPGDGGVRTARGVAGVPDGARLALGFKAFPSQAAYASLVRAQLRPLGIDVRVELLEPAVFVESVFTARDFDMAIVSYCNGTDPEIGVRRMYVSSNIAPVPFSNAAGYRNPVVDSLFDRVGGALDPAERGRLYRRIQEIAVRDLPYVWLVETEATRAYHTRCRGFSPSAHFAATARCSP